MDRKTNILGVDFQNNSQDDVKKIISESIKNGRILSIFTPNPEILKKAQQDQNLLSILNSAELLLPDGIGVILASRILGNPLRERITGIDTGEYLLSVAEKSALKVFLLGAREGVADKAKKDLEKRFPSLLVCGTHHGYFDKQGKENEAVLKEINQASPDILIVCFGCPSQEQWIYKNRPSLPSVRIFIGLGGAIDVWSGNLKRAPIFIRKLCLEWLWRALLQPSRISSLLHIPSFILLILRQKLSKEEKQYNRY